MELSPGALSCPYLDPVCQDQGLSTEIKSTLPCMLGLGPHTTPATSIRASGPRAAPACMPSGLRGLAAGPEACQLGSDAVTPRPPNFWTWGQPRSQIMWCQGLYPARGPGIEHLCSTAAFSPDLFQLDAFCCCFWGRLSALPGTSHVLV